MLKKIQRQAELRKINKDLETLEKRSSEVNTEADELGKKYEEEEITYEVLEEEIAKLEDLIEEIKEAKEELLSRKKDLEKEIEEDDKKIEEVKEERRGITNMETRKFYPEAANIRTIVRENEEVRSFYEDIYNSVAEKRATISGLGQSIEAPEVVVEDIIKRIAEYSVFYNIVRVDRISGDATYITYDGALKAGWGPKCSPLHKADDNAELNQVSLSADKLSAYVSLCKEQLRDTPYLAEIINDKLAEAMALELDLAIIKGSGENEPTGIKTAITKKETFEGVKDLILGAAKIKAKRKKYIVLGVQAYNTLMAESLTNSLAGSYVFAIANQELPGVDGQTVKILVSELLDDNDAIILDGDAYVLAERLGVEFAISTDVRFIEDETVFAAKARYDGNVIDKDKIVVGTLAPATNSPAA